jgi:hypothetical protein
VTELSVVIILALTAALIAGWSGAWLARLTPGDEQDHRLKRAMRSAADTLARRQGKHLLRTLAVNLLACAALGFGLGLHPVLWFGAGITFGVAVAWMLAQVATTFSLNAAAASAKVLGSVDSALVVNVRAASAVAQVSLLLSVLLGTALVLVTQQSDSIDTRVTSTVVLAGVLTGSLLALLFTLFSAGSMRVAGVVSRRCTSAATKQPLFWVDPTNPSFVADLVAQHTSAPQSWAQTGLTLALSLQLLAVLLDPLGKTNAGSPAGLTLTVLLLIQVAALASSAAVHLILRAPDGMRSWKTMLGYSLVAGGALAIFSLAGSVYWLLGEASRTSALGCGILGVLLGLAVAAFAERGRRHRGLEDADTQRRPVLDLLSSAENAFIGAAGSLVLLILAVVGAEYVSPAPGLPATDVFYLASGLLALLPYFLTHALLGPNLEATSSLCALRFERNHSEPTTNLNGLYAVAQDISFNGQSFVGVSTAMLAITAYLAVESAQAAASNTTASGFVAALGAIGALLSVLSLFAHQAHGTASVGVAEVTRHRRSEPPSLSPGYTVYVEQTTDRAFRRATIKCVGIVLGLLTFLALLRGLNPGSVGASRATFLAFLATSGSVTAFFALGLGFYLGTSRGSRRALTSGIDAPADVSTGTTLGFAESASAVLLPATLALVQLGCTLTIFLRVVAW